MARRRTSSSRQSAGISTLDLFRRLRDNPTFHIAAHNDRLWATNSFWLVEITPVSPLRLLLSEYNLPVEPMVCEVGRTLRRSPGVAPPVISGLFSAPTVTPIVPFTIGRVPMIQEDTDGTLCEVWQRDSDKRFVVLNKTYRSFVDLMVPGDSWGMGDPPHSVVRRLDEDGVTTALLMPIRTLLSDVANSDVAA